MDTTRRPSSPFPCVLIIVPLLSVMAAPCVVADAAKEAMAARQFTPPRTYEVNSCLTFRSGPSYITDLEAWLPVPQQTWLQQASDVQCEVLPQMPGVYKHVGQDPDHGNLMARVKFVRPGSLDAELAVSAILVTRGVVVRPLPGVEPKLDEYDRAEEAYVLYTQSEPFLESASAQIRALARELKGDEERVWQVAHRFHDGVVEHMSWQDTDRLLGAKHACSTGTGEAGEYAALFVALCRSAGIPARPIAGRRHLGTDHEGWSCWAEFMLPDGSWVPVDPEATDASRGAADCFGQLDSRTCVVCVGYNILLMPEPPRWLFRPHGRAGLLQGFAWGYHWRNGPGHDATCEQEFKVEPVSREVGAAPDDWDEPATTGPGHRARDEMIGPDGGAYVWVPPGKFMMGSDDKPLDAGPAHEVTITKGFWLSKYEVTGAQYAAFCEATGREVPPGPDTDQWYPAGSVPWEDAASYCERYGLALPTEAQWEYAARGSTAAKYPWGDEWDKALSCHWENRGPTGQASAAGSFQDGASWCGAMDMAGNVWEWCADWYAPDYYEHSEASDPMGPKSGSDRAIRGGSWYKTYSGCPSAQRARNTPTSAPKVAAYGFRPVLVPTD